MADTTADQAGIATGIGSAAAAASPRIVTCTRSYVLRWTLCHCSARFGRGVLQAEGCRL
ncbi:MULTISPECIES: hypothetical protein [unclassified Streptomyces]|uniref:hypothetical protein n=1 Tax=unclassified Streptomyces TaxID=2593676 RepID=UPI00333096F4